MPKFTLTCEHDGPVGSKNTLEFEADFLPTVLEHFRQFLKGCSFEFDGEFESNSNSKLDIIDNK